ncbi:MAG: TlpA family protein disulfide reductase [Chitinophagia bacterium]|jgi:thiol-disulfide isomerase/thioredoxin|nr:TlpA family protein disulfide reductase [Chitinophagia bacterium]
MKKLLILIIFLFPLLSYAQDGFTVTMRIKGLGEHQIKASIQRNGKYVIDTLTKIDTDLVVWKGKTVDPQLVRVEVIDTSLYLRVGKAVMAPPALSFLLNNTEIEIEADAKQIFTGTIESKDPEVQLYNSIRKADLEDAKENWALQQIQNRKRNLNDTIGNYDITQRLQYLKKKNQALRIQFLNDHPATFTSLLVLQSLFLILPISESEAKFYALTEEQKNSNTGKALILKIESNKSTAIGKPVIPFAQIGIDGTMVDINAYKGKVILIDFWGSWCVPCRISHPALKELYDKYKSKGFEIIGISNEIANSNRDKKKQDIAWRKAVKEDGLTWPQILYDPAIKDIVKEYDINGYPTKFLVDQNGKFVMRILGNSEKLHAELAAKLASLMPD